MNRCFSFSCFLYTCRTHNRQLPANAQQQKKRAKLTLSQKRNANKASSVLLPERFKRKTPVAPSASGSQPDVSRDTIHLQFSPLTRNLRVLLLRRIKITFLQTSFRNYCHVKYHTSKILIRQYQILYLQSLK